jgi:Na+/H+ antiporter NhaC
VEGFVYGAFGLPEAAMAAGEGVLSMWDLILVTLLAGGMLEIVRRNGGIGYIVQLTTSRLNSRKGAEFAITSLTALANVCTANNTIAIITVGGIASDISKRFGLDPRKVASILDTFSCIIQGIIPYGAQLLLASGLAGVTAISISTYLYYPIIMGICAILAILFQLPRKL